MKIFITILLMVFALNISAQNRGQTDDQRFNRAISGIKKEQDRKVQFDRSARFFSQGNCTTDQLIDICYYLPNDLSRYKLSLLAYPKIVDKENFFFVYDVFEQLSFAMRLYHNTQIKENFASYEVIDDGDVYGDYIDELYHSVKFPDPSRYAGPTGINCRVPMADNDFNYYLNHLQLSRDQNRRLEFLKGQVSNNCFSTAQVMKLGFELALEKDRLDFLKYASDKCFDKGNFIESSQLISHVFYKDELLAFIGSNSGGFYDPEPPTECLVSDEEFGYIRNSIKSLTFADKMKVAAKKNINKKCLSMDQLRVIVSLFSFDNDRLDMAKYAYDYAPYPDQMYKFSNLFTFGSSKREFDDYILGKQ